MRQVKRHATFPTLAIANAEPLHLSEAPAVFSFNFFSPVIPSFLFSFFFFFSVLFSFLFSFPRFSFLFTCSFLSILSPRSTLSSPLLRIGIHIPNPNYRPSHSRFLELLPTSLFSLLFFSSAGLRRFHRVRLVFPAVPSVAPPTAPFHRSITKKKKKKKNIRKKERL